MKIIYNKNIWTVPSDYKIVTTNGVVKKDGKLVMGKGVALQAKQKYPEIDTILGKLVSEHGNHVFKIKEYNIISFPTKYNWKDKSDINLIKRSCEELIEQIKEEKVKIVLPPPGCGNGGLKWEEVEKILSPLLDDRFEVIIWK